MVIINDPKRLEALSESNDIAALFTDWKDMRKRLVQYRRGEYLYLLHSSVSSLYLIVKGELQLSYYNTDGDIYNIAVLTPFTMLGEVEYILNQVTLTEAQAITDVMCIEIPINENQSLLKGDLVFSQYLNKLIAQKLTCVNHIMIEKTLDNVEVQFAKYLLRNITLGDGTVRDLKKINETLHCSYRQLLRVIRLFCEIGILRRSDVKGVYVLNRVLLIEKYGS